MALVSVIVVTYNSADFIVETLESVKNQTWDEIELIISDDFSKDKTVEVCKEWLEKNQYRFKKTGVITTEKNTGVPANVNRGIAMSTGEWLSLLAGDDTLKSNCIELNMEWIKSNPEVSVLFSSVDVYANNFEPVSYIETIPGDPFNPGSIMAPGRNAESQYKMLLVSDRIHYTPSLFINRNALIKVGGMDERFRIIEDHPLWLNLTKNGYQLFFMNKATVNYRRHVQALNYNAATNLINPNYFRLEEFRKAYTYPFLPLDVRLHQKYIWHVSGLFKPGFMNKNLPVQKILYFLLTVLLNPFKYWLRLRRIFNSRTRHCEFYN